VDLVCTAHLTVIYYCLIPFLHRPVSEEINRITPDGLQDYRKSHKFRGPCCLCPTDSIDAVYTESAIFMATGGNFSGKYLAACATGRCGYISESISIYNYLNVLDPIIGIQVSLDDMYHKPGLQAGLYPDRGTGC
jgi:hypothetical protein